MSHLCQASAAGMQGRSERGSSDHVFQCNGGIRGAKRPTAVVRNGTFGAKQPCIPVHRRRVQAGVPENAASPESFRLARKTFYHSNSTSLSVTSGAARCVRSAHNKKHKLVPYPW